MRAETKMSAGDGKSSSVVTESTKDISAAHTGGAKSVSGTVVKSETASAYSGPKNDDNSKDPFAEFSSDNAKKDLEVEEAIQRNKKLRPEPRSGGYRDRDVALEPVKHESDYRSKTREDLPTSRVRGNTVHGKDSEIFESLDDGRVVDEDDLKSILDLRKKDGSINLTVNGGGRDFYSVGGKIYSGNNPNPLTNDQIQKILEGNE